MSPFSKLLNNILNSLFLSHSLSIYLYLIYLYIIYCLSNYLYKSINLFLALSVSFSIYLSLSFLSLSFFLFSVFLLLTLCDIYSCMNLWGVAVLDLDSHPDHIKGPRTFRNTHLIDQRS